MDLNTFKGICDDISSSKDKQSFIKKALENVRNNMGDATHFALTIEDPPEYSIEDASVLSWTGTVAGKAIGVKLHSFGSPSKAPVRGNPDAVTQSNPSLPQQTQEDRGQLKGE